MFNSDRKYVDEEEVVTTLLVFVSEPEPSSKLMAIKSVRTLLFRKMVRSRRGVYADATLFRLNLCSEDSNLLSKSSVEELKSSDTNPTVRKLFSSTWYESERSIVRFCYQRRCGVFQTTTRIARH